MSSDARTQRRESRLDGVASSARWHELFALVAEGSERALSDLYDLAARNLFGLALWRTGSVDDASDVVQEVFVRVAQQGEKLLKVREPSRWLLTIAHRAAIDVVRKRRRTFDLEQCSELFSHGGDPTREVDGRRAAALLARLPAAQREAVYLRHFEGCTFAVIGTIAGVPTFTAASRYRLGLARLRRMLEERT